MNVWGFPPAVIRLLEKEFIRFQENKETEDLTSEFYLPVTWMHLSIMEKQKF